MEVLEIYRHEPDGSFSWITNVNSVKMARAIIRSSATNPSEEFLICDNRTDERISLRADGRWSSSKGQINANNTKPVAQP
jgi:hypothetical protein